MPGLQGPGSAEVKRLKSVEERRLWLSVSSGDELGKFDPFLVQKARDDFGRTMLHSGAYHGNHKAIKALLAADVPVNVQDREGLTALHVAVHMQQSQAVEVLMVNGKADPLLPDNNGTTPIKVASAKPNTPMLRAMLAAINDVGARYPDLCGQLLLRVSGASDDIPDAAKMLVDEHGTEVDVEDASGATPAHTAAGGGNHTLLGWLLKKGADPKGVDSRGWSVLHNAAASGSGQCCEIVLKTDNASTLLEMKANGGMTPLHVAAASEAGGAEAVKVLIAKGADRETLDAQGRTALHYASTIGVLAQVASTSISDAKDSKGRTPLHYAAAADFAEGVSLLINEFRATLSMVDNSGLTPLTVAASMGCRSAVSALLESGADVGARDGDGLTALHRAALGGHTDTLEVLLGQDRPAVDAAVARSVMGRTALHLAAAEGHELCCEVLMKTCKVPRTERLIESTVAGDAEGLTPMHHAAKKGSTRVLALLVSKGGMDVAPYDRVKRIPLYYAVRGGHMDAAKFLMDRGSSVSARAANGEFPIHAAAIGGSTSGLILLAQYGAAVNVTDRTGKSALHAAAAQGEAAAVLTLIQLGASPLDQDKKGRTPLDVAVEANQDACVDLLKRHM